MLKYIASEYKGIVIVPMTMVEPQYFLEIVGQLKKEGLTVQHYTLCASRERLLSRLRGRGEVSTHGQPSRSTDVLGDTSIQSLRSNWIQTI